MLKDVQNSRLNCLFRKILFGPFVFFLIIFMISPGHAANSCAEGGKQLRGDYERFQGDGGLWAQMERSASLKEKSMLGFQVDNKLMRVVTIFETKCDDGLQTNLSSESYGQVKNFIERGRKIYRTHVGRMSPKVFLKEIQKLNSDLEKFINGKGA